MEEVKINVSRFLLNQAIDCLEIAIEARNSLDIDKECQNSITIQLFLAIAMEGIINDIAESELDRWTWEEFERISTPLKWKLMDNLDPSKDPLQTIKKVHDIRNKIAHPKLLKDNTAFAIAKDGVLTEFLNDNDQLPDGDFSLYRGYLKSFKVYNVEDSLNLAKKLISIIEEAQKNHKLNIDEDEIKALKARIGNLKSLRNLKWKKDKQ